MMDNGKMPAMPNDTDTETLSIVHGIHNFNDFLRFRTGLTKREMFAMHFMASCRVGRNYSSWEDTANDAIDMADALLLALEQQK